MDLRAPLHDDARTDDDGRSTSPPPWRRPRSKNDDNDNDNYDDEIPSAVTKAAREQPPPIPNDHYSSPRGAVSNDAYYLERIVRHQLCRMHVASRVLELGSESRFTGIVLFHRYVRRFRRHVVSPSSSSSSSSASASASTDLRRTVASHLGKVASACILLGCKMEEEPRRIRDVVSLSRLLDFSSSLEEDDGGDDDEWDRATSGGDIMGSGGVNDDGLASSSSPGRSTMATIVESRRPPPLDERYWKAKDDLVSTEQHVLRMIRFDATVCHPHRCVLAIMETLGFGTGRDGDDRGGDGGGGGKDGRRGRRRDDDRDWLLRPDRSEDIILEAFRILNDAALDGTGKALRHPVVVLSCAAISLAASAGGVGGGGGGLFNGDDDDDCKRADNHDDGNAVAATLPNFWWRALDVSTEDITIARDALRKECSWEGMK